MLLYQDENGFISEGDSVTVWWVWICGVKLLDWWGDEEDDANGGGGVGIKLLLLLEMQWNIVKRGEFIYFCAVNFVRGFIIVMWWGVT